MLSNMSTKKKTKIMAKSSGLAKRFGNCNLNAVGAIEGGSATMPSNLTRPNSRLTTAVPSMPMRIAPGTLRAISTIVSTTPNSASSTGGDTNFPCVTNVAGCETTMPPIFKPMKAMNNPMPTAIAC